jgi:hypothetical protein
MLSLATDIPGNHTNNEEAYVGTIREMIKALKLNKPIVSGASMAGQVCVAVAIRADEVGAGGTIPLQGCDYLTMDRQFNDKSPVVNQSLFNPDWSTFLYPPKSLEPLHGRCKSCRKDKKVTPPKCNANMGMCLNSLRHDGPIRVQK